jgi:hypothetical protein
MDVMVLQRGDDAAGWTTIGRGLALDGRHTLLRVDPAGPPAPRSRLRLVSVGAAGVEAERLTEVRSLPQDGWTLTVARTAGPDRPGRSSAEVLALLTDPEDPLGAAAAGAPADAIRGGTTVAARTGPETLAAGPESLAAEPETLVAGPEPALSWLCRIFRIDCPTVVAG